MDVTLHNEPRNVINKNQRIYCLLILKKSILIFDKLLTNQRHICVRSYRSLSVSNPLNYSVIKLGIRIKPPYNKDNFTLHDAILS